MLMPTTITTPAEDVDVDNDNDNDTAADVDPDNDNDNDTADYVDADNDNDTDTGADVDAGTEKKRQNVYRDDRKRKLLKQRRCFARFSLTQYYDKMKKFCTCIRNDNDNDNKKTSIHF